MKKVFWASILAVYKFNVYSTKFSLMGKPGYYFPLAKGMKITFGSVIY